MPMRKPFVSPTNAVTGSGAPMPGMGMPPTPTMAGPQPAMTMGGAPGSAGMPPAQGPPMPGQPPLPGAGPSPMGGGPTSPMNIQSMLQSREPPQTMGVGAQPSPMTVGAPLPPWGDQGTMTPNQNGPKRVPIDMGAGGGSAMDSGDMSMGGGADMSAGGPTVMMRLLRSLGKI